ncbi:MAG: TRAP transporter substrate-binding protein [Lautropia sp.]
MTGAPLPRRRALGLAGAALATSAAVPSGARGANVSSPPRPRQEGVRLRFQSAWPAKDIFHEFANDFARKLSDMSGGRLEIEMLPAGAIAQPFNLLDAVARGVIDGAHGALSYWYGRNSALALWGCGPAFGMDANMVLAWHMRGGGRALLAEVYADLNLPVESFLYGPMPPQPLGWFRAPVATPADLRGLRYRTVGLSIDLFEALGASVQSLPAGEIARALDSGQLDAAEFNNATSDRILGLPEVAKVCMLGSFHQLAETFEVLINRPVYEVLAPELRALFEHAVQAASTEMSWKAIDRYSRDFEETEAMQGVRYVRTSEAILRAQLDAWARVVEKKSRENPMFARVHASMRAFARRAARWQVENAVDLRLAYEHVFPPRPR